MKTTTKLFGALFLLACATMLASFATLPGGDSFEVYLDNELIMKEHVYAQRHIKPLVLDKNSDASLAIHFNHCGVTGTSRSLTLRDEKQKVLKEWTFKDVNPSIKDPMPVTVSDLAAVTSSQKNVSLYYTSKELDNAVMLAPVSWVDKSTASKK